MGAVAPGGPFGGCAVLLSQSALGQSRICLQAGAVHLLVPLHGAVAEVLGPVPCHTHQQSFHQMVCAERVMGALNVPCVQHLPRHPGVWVV